MSKICALLALCGLLGLTACAGESPNPGPAPTGSDGSPGVMSDSWSPPSNPSNPSNPNPSPPAADSGAASSGNLSCTELYSCFYSCSENDTTCAGNCVGQGTSTAQSQYQAVYQCESNAGCSCGGDELTMTCATCLDAACSQPYAACGFVYSTCAQVTACFDQCADNDTACIDTCYSKLTMVGLAELAAADTCWDNALAGTCASSCTDQQSDTCYTCVDAQCATEFQTCGWI